MQGLAEKAGLDYRYPSARSNKPTVALIFAGLLWDGAVAASSSPAAAPLSGSSRQMQCFVAPKVEGTVLVGQPNGWWRAAERLGLLSPAGINPAA